jgi:hypothetical protein
MKQSTERRHCQLLPNASEAQMVKILKCVHIIRSASNDIGIQHATWMRGYIGTVSPVKT